jgi:hypothetical protein
MARSAEKPRRVMNTPARRRRSEGRVPPYNKQFEPTVMRRHVRAASAPFHYALAARRTLGRAAAQLRRYTSWKPTRSYATSLR